jgi:hypothetical protein
MMCACLYKQPSLQLRRNHEQPPPDRGVGVCSAARIRRDGACCIACAADAIIVAAMDLITQFIAATRMTSEKTEKEDEL